jgi:hypothetical protein
MNRIVFSLLTAVLLTGVLLAQAQPNPPGNTAQQAGASDSANQANTQAQPGNVMYAELAKSIDAKKAKVGDEVVARSTQALLSKGKVVVPQGGKIIGHVTQVKASTKEAPQSELGIVFEHVLLKDGSQLPLALTIQAIGAARGPLEGQNAVADQGGGMGPMGGTATVTGHPTSSPMGSARPSGYPNDMGAGTNTGPSGAGSREHLNALSHGAVGLSGLTLSAASSGLGSVITSEKKNVKLDGGTELLLRISQ